MDQFLGQCIRPGSGGGGAWFEQGPHLHQQLHTAPAEGNEVCKLPTEGLRATEDAISVFPLPPAQPGQTRSPASPSGSPQDL